MSSRQDGISEQPRKSTMLASISTITIPYGNEVGRLTLDSLSAVQTYILCDSSKDFGIVAAQNISIQHVYYAILVHPLPYPPRIKSSYTNQFARQHRTKKEQQQ